MTAQLKKTLIGFAAISSFLIIAFSVSAAAPDGSGPWADNVVSSSQGLRKDSSAVPAVRSDPTSALGVAENNTTDGNFFSLGFGGNIVLGFDNGISSGTIDIVEATNPNYPIETAKIEVSQDGSSWIPAGTVSQDGSVDVPEGVTCVKFVRVTDTSNPEDFSDTIADGYDVDGVKLTGESCQEATPTPTATPTPSDTPTPTPTPGTCNCGCGSTIVKQSNTTLASTTIFSGSNTGGNNSNGNAGGSNSITTGNTNTSTSVSVTGGSNTNVTNACCSCCGSGNTNITITGNGIGSHNIVVSGNIIKKKK